MNPPLRGERDLTRNCNETFMLDGANGPVDGFGRTLGLDGMRPTAGSAVRIGADGTFDSGGRIVRSRSIRLARRERRSPRFEFVPDDRAADRASRAGSRRSLDAWCGN